jgi:hypothetical protein
MEFSWNKWRQYVIEEASVNEIDSRERETLGLFKFAVKLGVLEPQDYDDLEKVAMDPDAYEEGLDFNAIEAVKINKALTKIFNIIDPSVSTPASQIYGKLKGGEELDGYDLGNALQIYNRFQGQEAGNTSPEDLDAAAGKFDSLEEDKFDQPGWDLKAIMGAFKEDFEEATRDTDDIVYAQERVIAAYKDVFAKSHPKLSREIDMYLNNKDAETRKMFQNVADDPEVVGRDMMSEGPIVATFNVGDIAKLIVDRKLGTEQPGPKLKVLRVEDQIGGEYQNVLVQNLETMEKVEYDNEQLALVEMGKISREEEAEEGGMFGELEGEVQSENDEALDEAQNEMALEKALAMDLDKLQNNLEDMLDDDELDTFSNMIALLNSIK